MIACRLAPLAAQSLAATYSESKGYLNKSSK